MLDPPPTSLPRPTQFDVAPQQVVVACTFDPLGFQGPLNVWLERLVGLRTSVQWTGYGTTLEVLCDAHSVWNANSAGVNVLLLRLCDLTPERESSETAAKETLEALVSAVRGSCAMRRGPTIVLLPPPDDGGPRAVPASDSRLNEQLAAALSSIDGVRLLGGAALSNEWRGERRFYCRFLDLVAQAPFAPAALSGIAAAATREIARAVAVGRKVLCLDCDNTLWRGAVAEVGAAGVGLDGPFLEAQRFFVGLQARGLLLCLCSRNHEADVRAVFEARAGEMLLQLEHVVAIKANWEPKSANVLALAHDLCLDPSTFVFVDDSPVECAEVTAGCAAAGVTVVRLPREPEAYGPFLSAHWAFDLPPAAAVQTNEDVQRTTLYRELAERKEYAK
eukprot:3658957-Prymnesium_polylepis.1